MNEKNRQFGEDLAQQRSQKGISLEAMSRATKIRKPVLEALESGKFDELPPEVFVVGFLQAYASHLGVDPAPVVARYKRLVEAPLPLEKQQEWAKAQSSPGGGRSPALALGIVIAILLVAAGAYLIWAWNSGGWPFQDIYRPPPAPEEPSAPANTPETQPPPAWPTAPSNEAPPTTPAVNEPAPSNTPGAPGDTPAPGTTNAPATGLPLPTANVPSAPPSNALAPPPQPPPSTPALPLPTGDVVIVCTKRCWIEMSADGKRKLYREVTPGERLVYDGKRFLFNIGNPQGIQLTYLGQSVPLPETGGKALKNFVLPSAGGPPR